MNCCSDKIDFNDFQCVRLYFENVHRAKEVGLELSFDEEGFFLRSEFNVDGLQIQNDQKVRIYRVNNVSEAMLFIEAWYESKIFQESLVYLNNNKR